MTENNAGAVLRRAGTGTETGTVADPLVSAPNQIVATAGTATRVASSATNVTLIAANSNRAGLLVHNNSTAILYIKFGATAVASGGSESYTVQIASQGNWAMPEPIYTGQIDAIWASANGFAMITETT